MQGVGFRPAMFRLADALGVTGFVRNERDGVLLEIEGEPQILDEFVEKNQSRLEDAREELGKRAVPLASTVASSVAAVVTVLVLAILMLMSGPDLQRTTLEAFTDETRRERVRRVSHDAAAAVTRYMAGNLIISVIAGVASFLMLLICGVPFRARPMKATGMPSNSLIS